MRQLSLGIASVALLAGCATQAKFEQTLASWIGASEDRLVSNWGPPTSTYPMSNGSKILTYQRGGSAFIPGYQTATTTVYGNQAFTQVNGSPGMMIQQSCRVDWTIDSSGTITNWRWEGNACRAR